ncbi:hypothetical protein AB0873_16515 [Micromonospora sp. NPDC047707]|uniref:hypothetical protein n=1 Tax=Micromonospora sp. NPDC047707 TaxID=3154498 RepID=UPI0034536C73
MPHDVDRSVEVIARQAEQIARFPRPVIEVPVYLRAAFESADLKLRDRSSLIDERERGSRHRLDRSPPAHLILLWAPGEALTNISLRQWSQSRMVGTPTEVARQLRRWDDTGVEQVICSFGAPFAVHDDEQLELAIDTMALLDSS